jgi:folate-binding protein YgfZ
MSEPGDAAVRARQSVGLFECARGLISVTGSDRVHWLNGMISGDVAVLEPGLERSGCYALLLTPKGSIIADLHVLAEEDELLLELDATGVSKVVAHLSRYVISEDVELSDVSSRCARFAIEGPDATRLLAQAGCSGAADLARDSWMSAPIGSVLVDLAAWGSSGESAFQAFVEPETVEPFRAALREASSGLDLVEAGADALELLRIEAGTPRLGMDLDEEVLPAEARLTERAVSFTKGCYTGQEIVARIESRGQVNHLLVGLRFRGADGLPALGAKLMAGEKVIGEVTSACVSPREGLIGLGYVRRPFDVAGTELLLGTAVAEVADLPFVAPAGGGS